MPKRISADFNALYWHSGRPSIGPERLLKGQLLITLYSVRGDQQLCEPLDYNLLFRRFLDMGLEKPRLDRSNFSRLLEQLVSSYVTRR